MDGKERIVFVGEISHSDKTANFLQMASLLHAFTTYLTCDLCKEIKKQTSRSFRKPSLLHLSGTFECLFDVLLFPLSILNAIIIKNYSRQLREKALILSTC